VHLGDCIHQGLHLRSPHNCPTLAEPSKQSLLIMRCRYPDMKGIIFQKSVLWWQGYLFLPFQWIADSAQSSSDCSFSHYQQPFSPTDTNHSFPGTKWGLQKTPEVLTIAIQTSLLAESSSPSWCWCDCFLQSLEPWEAGKVLCGANVSPPIMFQSLNCWPGCFGNQPNQTWRERIAACNFRLSLGMCS
jgi:hypothetical protein